MKLFTKIAVPAAALSMVASTAFAVPPQAGDNPGNGHVPSGTPTAEDNPGSSNAPEGTPTAENNRGASRRAGAPGQYCRNASREHVEGMRRTPFAECVVAQARLRRGTTRSPREACRAASREHVEGMRRTPFAECVVAGARLLRDRQTATS